MPTNNNKNNFGISNVAEMAAAAASQNSSEGTPRKKGGDKPQHRRTESNSSSGTSIMAHELRKLVDTANAPIFGIDTEGNVNEWNFKTAEITGYSRDEAFHKPLVSTFIAPRLRESVQEVLDNALEGKETSNYELEFETRKGDTRYLLVNATTRRDAENNIVGVVGVAQDVTEAAKHDRAVAAAAHELRQLVDTANAPIFGIDVKGNVNEWNNKTAEITGYSKEEAFDKPLVETFIVTKLRRSVQEVLDNALQGRETSNYELEFRTKSNETRYLLVNATTRRDAHNNIVGVVGVAQDVTEAAQHDRAVAAMARELRQLVDTANAPIFGIDINGMVNEWNYKTAEITGFSKEEAFDKPLVSTFIMPKLRQSVQQVMENALQGRETSNYELEFATKTNKTRYLLVNATTRRDEDNNIVGVVGVAQDVTESKRHDRAVAAMANELRQLVDTANAPIFGIDVFGNVNEWNDKTAEITGFSKEEAFNKPLVSTFIMPKLRRSIQEVMDSALRGNETSNYELEFCTKSDEIRYLLVNATTRRDEDSNIVGVVGVAQDVTESKRHDRAVAAMANELRQLVDTANAPIFGIDMDGNVNEWNNKTAEITGFTKEEALNRPLVTTFIMPKLRRSVQEVMDNALQGNETSNYELEFWTKSNETRYLLVNATTRRDEDNNIVGVVGVAQDVTESKKHDRAVAAMANELRQLVDTANAPIFGIDVNGNVNEWNEKTAEVTGFSKEEAFHKPLVSTFIVPKLRQSVQDVLENALRGNETSNYELEFRTKSNEIRYLLVNATTRRDADYNIVGVVGVAQDVTESSKNDRAVAAMANELRQLVDTANAPIFGIDVHGNVNEWNDKTAEITGFSKEEAFNRPMVSTFIEPKLQESVQTVLDNALHGNETSNYQLEFRTKSNETRYLLVNATTRRDADSNIVGVVGVAQDVTESSKNDRAIAAMAHELRQLVDTANAPIFGIDVNGNVNEWNNKTAEITGFTKEEAFDNPLVTTFIVPSLRQSVQEVLENALRGIETSNYELEFETKSKEIRYLLVNATTRRDAENNIVGVVGVAQDVTESTKNDRAMSAMARELRQLVDTANAPIFGIDVDGDVNEWNDKTAEITGFTKEEAFDFPLVETFIVPSLRQSVQEVLDNALKGIETSNYELEFRTKTNEVRYLLVNATTRRDAENNIVGVVGVAQDVTEAAQHDRAVAAMANELRQLVDTANAPIFGIDVNGDVNEWNNKTAEITGYTKEEAWNKPLVSTFIVASLRQSVQEVLDNALQGRETSNYELEFRTKSNEIRYLLVNATTRRDPHNNIVGVVGVAQDVTESKRHDRAVAAMANELRQLVDTANAPIFGIDVLGNVNEWNFKTAEITGFSKEEAFDKPLVEAFIVPSLRQSVQEVLNNALQGIETSNYELEFRTKSEEIRYLLVNATTRRDAENNIVGVVGVAQDVTEAAKHDRAVAAMANELRLLVDTANAPIFGIDVHGNVNEWNDKTAEITGFSKEEAMNYPLVSTFIVPKLRQSVQEVLDNALRGEGTSNYELEFRTKSNEIRYLLVNATTRRDAENNIVGVVGVAQDVTEAAKHDRAVAAMANELRQLIDTANAPIFGIDVDGDVNEWNEKTAEITGFSKEEAFDKPLVSTFIVPSLRQSVQEVLDNALKGRGTSNYELEFRTKSNEIRYLLVNATTRRDAENNIVGVVGVAQDVTEAAQHDRAVAAMARELRQLVDTANAPIFGIDVDGNVNEWNDKTAEITGFSGDEAFNQPLVETFIVPKLRPSVQEVLDNALKGVETSNYELEFRTKSNEIRYLLVNATTRRDAENNIVGVVGVAQDVTEAAKHDRAVAAMANELRQLIDTANAPIFGIDVDGDVNEWNDKTAEITGFSKEEAFDKPLVSTFIVPSLRQSVQEVLDNALKGRGTSNYELEFRTKSNEIRYLLVNATTRRDAENNIVGVVGVAQDVTEAAKHDRAVAAMANELRQLVDTANAPIFGIDVHGNVNEWNNKTAEITGFSGEEAFGNPLVETFIVPKLRESVNEVLDNALKGVETSNYELEFRTKSNEVRYLLVNATTRRDAESNIVGVVGVAQDVTEAAQHDRAVAAMANELRQLVDTANAPIFGIDVNGNVNEWNNKTAEITGFSKKEAFDKPLVSTFIVPSLRNSVQEVLDKALHGNETSNYELEFETKSKEIRYLLVNATTRRDAENNIVGVVGVAQDVTDDRKHSEELREMQYIRASQEAKVETERNMTAYFAHELRNPLHAIDSALNSMPDGLPDVAQGLVDAMQLCTGFMSSIMNNLLDVRKMEEGKMTLTSAPISLEATLNSVHKMLLPSVRPSVAFQSYCKTGEKGWVLGDSHRIQQVLTNVVTNAIKYTTSGSITLVIEWEDENVRFECADTGPGIPVKEQKKLFERFVQRGGAPGTGLGLAIAKHLVDLTGGSICFHSDPTIKPGTSCVVKMPLAVCEPPEVVVKEEHGRHIEEPLSFLLIDDVAMNRSMLSRRIKRGIAPNAIITEASTGEEALVICGKQSFDVIVVDQYMEEAGGVMVGTDVVFAMRRMRIDSIIIGCSGNDMDDLFKEAGCDWVWGKPMPSNATTVKQLRSALAVRKAKQASE